MSIFITFNFAVSSHILIDVLCYDVFVRPHLAFYTMTRIHPGLLAVIALLFRIAPYCLTPTFGRHMSEIS
jgi:hypothetical protein